MEILDLGQPLRTTNLHGRNNFRGGPDSDLSFGAVALGRSEEVAALGADPICMAVGDCRKEQEVIGFQHKTLLTDAAFTQQNRLPPTEQTMNRRTPFLESRYGVPHRGH